MKLQKLKFNNHKTLGNLEIDFCVDGEPMSTVIIAGENGTGKTTILNTIYNLSGLQPTNIDQDEGLTYFLSLSQMQIDAIQNNPGIQFQSGQEIEEDIVLEVAPSERQDWSRFKITGKSQGQDITLPPSLFAESEFRKVLRLLYSNVAINFTPKNITSVTAKNIDEVTSSQITSQNTATEITQLLIDIQALDDADLSRWVRDNRGKAVQEDVLDKRISRFQEAFSIMFPKKRYKEIVNFKNQKKVVFTDNGKDCYIEDLSSGEKQIVFRGGFFLKDTHPTSGAISIIDEPEISLHPKWQLNIVDFYKSILEVENKLNHSQMIIATHSPFILHNHNRSNDKIIVLKQSSSGDICVADEPEFFGWTHEEAIKEAFSISPDQEDSKPLVLVEGETDEKYINAAIELLDVDIGDTEVKWVGRISENGNAEFTGDKALNHTMAFVKANPSVITRPVILLYDSDTRKPESNHKNMAVRVMPFCNDSNIRKGIENLLNLPDELDMTTYLDEHNKVDDYGVPNTIRSLNKNRLCDHLIEASRSQHYDDVFRNFGGLIQSMINTINELKSG